MAENEQIVKDREETSELSEDGKEIEAELEEVRTYDDIICSVE